ncbi:hypothetical protein N0P42_001139 [Enterobacter hormaechei]|nr:hypothetical protein [Enterobacter hormaechei]
MKKLHYAYFALMLTIPSLALASASSTEVRVEGNGYVNLSPLDEKEGSEKSCDIHTGLAEITSLQYDEANQPNKIEFTSGVGEVVVLSYETRKMNTFSLSNADRGNLEVFPVKGKTYFIKFRQCSGANGGELERNLMEIYRIN